MELNKDVVPDVVLRLRRIQGQIGGIIRMIDDGRDCEDVVTQFAAASRALHRAGFAVIAAGMRQCATDPDTDQSAPSQAVPDHQALERLFLTLA